MTSSDVRPLPFSRSFRGRVWFMVLLATSWLLVAALAVHIISNRAVAGVERSSSIAPASAVQPSIAPTHATSIGLSTGSSSGSSSGSSTGSSIPPPIVPQIIPPLDTSLSSALASSTKPSTSPSTAPVFVQSADVTEGNAGPWGKMQYVPIVLEVPESYTTVAQASAVQNRWAFTGRDRSGAIALLSDCGVSAQQLAMIPADAWQETGDAAPSFSLSSTSTASSVAPPDALLLSLNETVRAKLYAQLMLDPANEVALDPVWFRVGRVDFRLRSCGLGEASIALLKRLLYPGPDGLLLFNDEPAALRAIADPQEQDRFLKAIERKRSLMARLLLTADSDTAALAKYWGKGGREANLRPLLDSVRFNAMAGVENPGRINILSLLPPFVQERLYRHAELTVADGRIPDDCYWTAFNFFNAIPDDRVHEMDYFTQMLNRAYEKIDQPGELGDVILITTATGRTLHAANYIADNVVFTKNGYNGGSPWMLAPMRDVIDTYRIKNDVVKTFYFRKR